MSARKKSKVLNVINLHDVNNSSAWKNAYTGTSSFNYYGEEKWIIINCAIWDECRENFCY